MTRVISFRELQDRRVPLNTAHAFSESTQMLREGLLEIPVVDGIIYGSALTEPRLMSDLDVVIVMEQRFGAQLDQLLCTVEQRHFVPIECKLIYPDELALGMHTIDSLLLDHLTVCAGKPDCAISADPGSFVQGLQRRFGISGALTAQERTLETLSYCTHKLRRLKDALRFHSISEDHRMKLLGKILDCAKHIVRKTMQCFSCDLVDSSAEDMRRWLLTRCEPAVVEHFVMLCNARTAYENEVYRQLTAEKFSQTSYEQVLREILKLAEPARLFIIEMCKLLEPTIRPR